MEIQQVINDSLNVFSIDSRGVILECSKFFGNHPEICYSVAVLILESTADCSAVKIQVFYIIQKLIEQLLAILSLFLDFFILFRL